MTTTITRTRLSADRAARFIERAVHAGLLDPDTRADAAALLETIDAGTVRGLSGAVQSLLDGGFRRGALAVAAAETPRETRSAVAGIKAVAALAGALGLGVSGDADDEPAPAASTEPESVADLPADPAPIGAPQNSSWAPS